MGKKSSKIQVDGKLYNTSDLTQDAIKLIRNLDRMKIEEHEKMSMIAVLKKAKLAYMSELKSEMLSAKSGIDFSE